MAILESALYSALSGDAAIAAVVGSGIYPVIIPQDAAFPAITYTRISGGQQNDLTGYEGTENPRMQIDVWGKTYAAVKDLAAKVRAAMNAAITFSAIQISDQDLYEDDMKIYRVSMDFSVWFNT